MRILFTTIHSKNLVNLNAVYNLEKHISEKVECKWAGVGHDNHVEGESLDETVSRLYGDDPPDWVVSNNAHLPTYLKMMKCNGDRDYKIAVTLADLHSDPDQWVKAANWADAVLMRYLETPYMKQSILGKTVGYRKSATDYYRKKISSPILHFPWFTDPDIYSPVAEKEYDVIFLGAHREKVYPFRHQLVNELPRVCESNGWRYLVKGRPPGKTLERDIEKLKQEGYLVGDLYGKTVASSKVFIFGNSIFRYPLSKYFEIMGSGTLVMANKPQSAEELGFIDGETYVKVDSNNWKQRLAYYLEHNEEREMISRNGYNHVLENHSVRNRSGQLIDFLESLG